jgi:hypothetical protein
VDGLGSNDRCQNKVEVFVAEAQSPVKSFSRDSGLAAGA